MNNQDHLIGIDHRTISTDWYHLWCSFGFNEYQWTLRATKVQEYTQKLLNKKLLKYKEELLKRKELLEELLDDYEDLLERTGLSSSIQYSIFNQLKLREQEIYLDKKMEELLINENELINQRNKLENKENYFCKLLNISPIETNIPISLIQINEKLQHHIQMLTQLKEERFIKVSSYYLKIKKYSEKLEWIPFNSSSTIKYLLIKQFDHCLTIDSLNEIEKTLYELENQIEFQKKSFFNLHNQLTHLYQSLKKDPNKDYCLAYQINSEDINASIIKQLENEINSCRNERMKNGKEYCHLIRQQILNLLEKSYLNDNERIIIDKLHFEILSTDLLDKYDEEFQRISKLYEKRQPVIQLYEKSIKFYNEILIFTKTSTDPGRFHLRGYNAQFEERQRKKFQKQLLIIEQEFLNILSEYNDQIFLINNLPIQQIFHQIRQQISTILIPINTPTTSRLFTLTKTPTTTPRKVVNKQPFILGTAITNTARRPIKTPVTTLGRKLLNKVTNHRESQSIRAKPRSPPLSTLLKSSSPNPIAKLSIHPPICNGDQSLDFSFLHTMTNVYGQIKIMTSTPNTSYIPMDNSNHKTAHNTINQRRSKQRSKRTPFPILTVEDTDDETIVCL